MVTESSSPTPPHPPPPPHPLPPHPPPVLHLIESLQWIPPLICLLPKDGSEGDVLWSRMLDGYPAAGEDSISSHPSCTSWRSGQPSGLSGWEALGEARLLSLSDTISSPDTALRQPAVSICLGNSKVPAEYF